LIPVSDIIADSKNFSKHYNEIH